MCKDEAAQSESGSPDRGLAGGDLTLEPACNEDLNGSRAGEPLEERIGASACEPMVPASGYASGEWALIRSWGYTLIEMTITLALVATLAMIALPMYVGYLEKARVARVIAEIHMFSKAIDLYELDEGELPASLVLVGLNGVLDPWGNPYKYLKIAGAGNGQGASNGLFFHGPNKAYAARGDRGSMAQTSGRNDSGNAWYSFGPRTAYAAGGGPPGGEPPGGGSENQPRKDRFLVPINSDYDLYSKGKNGDSVPPLTAPQSRDDIVRAADGSFVGIASEF